VGYSFAFGRRNAFFGTFNYAAMNFTGLDNFYGENADPVVGSTVP
jgi:hypothetical protein